MTEKTGRNDPCPCGSGKKYKSCCWGKAQPGRKKFKATLISKPTTPTANPEDNLMDRLYGNAIKTEQPLLPPKAEENTHESTESQQVEKESTEKE